MTKKYWIYKLKNSNEIYAYTDDKNIALLFESQRNMKKFIKKKKELDRRGISFLAKEYRSNILKVCEYNTYDNIKNITYRLAVTENEDLSVKNLSFVIRHIDIKKQCIYDTRIFNSDIRKALKILGYKTIYKENNDLAFYDSPDIKIDTVNLFLKNYGKTMEGS